MRLLRALLAMWHALWLPGDFDGYGKENKE